MSAVSRYFLIIKILEEFFFLKKVIRFSIFLKKSTFGKEKNMNVESLLSTCKVFRTYCESLTLKNVKSCCISDLWNNWNHVYYLWSIETSEQIVYWLIILLKMKVWNISERLIYHWNYCVMCQFGTSWKSCCLYCIDRGQSRNEKTRTCPSLVESD